MISCHNHTDYSNLRLLDCLLSVEELIKTTYHMGYKGLAVTDHESISAHVKAIQKTRELKEKGELPEDFKLILGNECYLIDSLEEVREGYQSGVTKFPHFLLLATNKEGHELLRVLSSKAWERSFFTGTMERTPTLKSDLEEILKGNQGKLIGSSACLGSETSIHLIEIMKSEFMKDQETIDYHKQKLHEFITWCVDVFGKDYFFLELQPALSPEQKYVNEKLVLLSQHYGLKTIITTDSHYARPEDRVIHAAFLNAKDGEREINSFYEACFIQSGNEIRERLNYLSNDIIDEAIKNTMLIGEMCEEYTIENETIIPQIKLPEFEVQHLFGKGYETYPYIKKLAYSHSKQDQYLIHLLEKGFQEKLINDNLTSDYFHQVLGRINLELSELWELSAELNQTMSSYYISVREIIQVIWDDECGGNSLVPAGRGSSSGFLINFLIDITQINPLNYGVELPHWRHLHKSRPDIGALDIDIDTEGNKRQQILLALKTHFGHERILQVSTFGTEGSKSALQTAARGLNIDSDIAIYLSSLIPFERGQNYSLSDCLYGNKDKERKAVKELIRELEKYPELRDTALKIEGKINKRSIHAGGIILFPESYWKSNALMKAPNGTPVTQFSLDDCQSVGNIKYD